MAIYQVSGHFIEKILTIMWLAWQFFSLVHTPGYHNNLWAALLSFGPILVIDHVWVYQWEERKQRISFVLGIMGHINTIKYWILQIKQQNSQRPTDAEVD